MKAIFLPKRYSEAVIRKSLYWSSASGDWKLTEEQERWRIDFSDNEDRFETIFHRHLNDFLLRETMDAKTQHLRHAIVESALRGLLTNVKR